jgi:hypothetical protein
MLYITAAAHRVHNMLCINILSPDVRSISKKQKITVCFRTFTFFETSFKFGISLPF